MWGSRAQGVSLVGLLMGVSLLGGMALAQGPQNPFAGECNRTATPEDIELAKQAHQAARQFFERGEYEKAAKYWRDVFDLDCNATGTLLNIANANERLGDRQMAIFALETYIKRKPDADDAPKIKIRIENLKKSLAAQPPATASATASTTPTSSASVPPVPTAPPPPPVKPFGVAPWVTVGLGGAALVAGGVLTTMGLLEFSALELTKAEFDALKAGEDGCYEAVFAGRVGGPDAKPAASPGSNEWICSSSSALQRATDAKTPLLIGKIALGVGGAAVVGGLVWELVFNKPVPAGKTGEKPSGSIHFAPSLSPNMTGAVVHGSF